jgi:membrane protease subunit HflC
MKNRLILILGLLIGGILVAYMFAFIVRYDEVAIVTTFGRVKEPTDTDPGSVKRTPRIYFRWPQPIQQVHHYSTQVQLIEERASEQTTSDGFSVVVRSYLAWRIDDPLKYHRTLGGADQARKVLESRLAVINEVIGRYRFDQLVNLDRDRVRLAEIERLAAEEMQQQLSETYGIKVEQVGIRRLVLPEQVTTQVFERMKSARQALAADAEAIGKGRAQAIKSEAESLKQRILAFARLRAEEIRAQGIADASRYYQVFGQSREAEQFAIFLRELEAIREMFKHRTTFVLGSDFAPLRHFMPPDAQPRN